MARQMDFHAMGTGIRVILDADERADPVLQQVPVWFEAWEQCLSRFRPDSELTRLNQSSGQACQVSDTLWQVICLGMEMEEQSGGWVTPAILPALEAAGYDRSFDWLDLSRVGNAGPVQAAGSIGDIIHNPRERQVLLPPGMRLDFGGLAKGWAVHQTMLRLAEYGPVLVDGGGDIAISQPLLAGQNWPVAVEDAVDSEAESTVLSIASGGVATSGRNRRRWMANGIWQHHLIDPIKGQPAETDILTVTVLAGDVMRAEMAAKTVFLMGSRDGLDWLVDRPDLQALIHLQDGSQLRTEGFGDFEWRYEWNAQITA